MLTVVPDARARLKVCPAGTVNELMFTVVHLTAAETSLIDEIVPVHEADGAAKAPCASMVTARYSEARESIVFEIERRHTSAGS